MPSLSVNLTSSAGAGAHLARDLTAMDADGDFAPPQFAGGLFIGEARHDKREHFPFTVGKSIVAALQLASLRPLRPLRSVQGNRLIDRPSSS